MAAAAPRLARNAAPSRAPARAPDRAPRRPPLRSVPPAVRRRSGRGRPLLVLSAVLALGSLLTVVAAHAYLVQGQVGLSHLDQRLTAEETTHRSLEEQVAQLEEPDRIVASAQHQGLVSPKDTQDLLQVPLSPQAPATSSAATASTGTASTAATGGSTHPSTPSGRSHSSAGSTPAHVPPTSSTSTSGSAR
jgi:hypothetical protein